MLILIAWAIVATIAAIIGWCGLVETQALHERALLRTDTAIHIAAELTRDLDEMAAFAGRLIDEAVDEQAAASIRDTATAKRIAKQVAANQAAQIDVEWAWLNLGDES